MDTIVEATSVDHPVARTAAATPTAHAACTAAPGEYLSCRLGREEYAIDILRVQEIRSYEAPTRIAGAPAHVPGATNLRGVIVPVIDLRLLLGCERADLDARSPSPSCSTSAGTSSAPSSTRCPTSSSCRRTRSGPRHRWARRSTAGT
jgi:hypothetical protein